LSNPSKYDRLNARYEAQQERWAAMQERWDAKRAEWAEQEAARPEIMAELYARFEARFGHRDDFEERWAARKERIEARWERQDERREERMERWEERAERWEKQAERWEERLDKYRPEPEPDPAPEPEPEPQPEPDPEPEPQPAPEPEPQPEPEPEPEPTPEPAPQPEPEPEPAPEPNPQPQPEPEPEPEPAPAPEPDPAPQPEPDPEPEPEPEPAPEPEPEAAPEPEPEPAQDPVPGPLASYTSGLGTFGVTSAFNITVNFIGEWSTDLQGAFIKASEYLSTLIVGDVQDIAFADGTFIDDLTITAELMTIDGTGGVLGRAGPTQARNQNSVDDWIPTQGLMEYDIADAQWLQDSGYLDDVVAHEMMHALGFGTMWQFHDLTTGSIQGGDLAYTGENAVAAYQAALQSAGADSFDIREIPLEMDGGPGTAGSHWDEAVFTTELMTGWLNAGAEMSAMSVASLEDMGYDTIFDAENPNALIPQLDDFILA